MSEHVTAKFDTYTHAEEAAAKLRAIRTADVEISEWDEQHAVRSEGMSDYLSGFIPQIGQYYPVMGGGESAGRIGPMSFAAADLYVDPDPPSQTFILNALVTPDQREKAIRIIRDCGGEEI